MRNPERVLNSLTEHCKIAGYKYQRLYRILFNEELFYIAYERVSANKGSMTSGSDGNTIDGMSLSRIAKLIASLKDESYRPKPTRRVNIPKKNGKTRPLGVPTTDDKLVQEVVRMILEAIYEGQFEYTSHGFRPHRSCHTALAQVQKSFCGAKWFVEGDIKGFFDNIDHDVLISILSERIADHRFLRLIRKLLNAGYIEDWNFHNTYSGTPQGGIVSPLLANIYLDKLDKYMKEYIQNFDKGKNRKPNKEYMDLDYLKRQAVVKLKSVNDNAEKAILVNKIKELQTRRFLLPVSDEMDESYRRLKYVRYADDFLIGVIGSKEDAKRIKKDIKTFLADKLALELSDEKTLITHTEKPAKFLGYEISVSKDNSTRRDTKGRLRRSRNKRLLLKVNIRVIRDKLLELQAIDIKVCNGKEVWKPRQRAYLIYNDDLEILERYNAEIRGFSNYFSIANNSALLHKFKYNMEYSMYKTFAGKYRSSVKKITNKYRLNGDFTVSYVNKDGVRRYRRFYYDGFKRKNPLADPNLDVVPNTVHCAGRTSLVDRLQARKCELCGETDNLNMHHIRKLKNLKGKEPWVRMMIARKRKTLAVCEKCHRLIHSGKLQTDNVSGEPDTRRRVSPVRGRAFGNLPQKCDKAPDA